MMRWMAVFSVVLLGLGLLGCEQDVDEGELEGAVVLEVQYEGEAREVDLGELVADPDADEPEVPLDEVVSSAWPDLMLDNLLVDFAAGDGFRPASRSNCVDLIPLDGSLLSQGVVHALTGKLSWDESLGMPGCLQITDLASLFLSDDGSVGRSLRFVLGDVEREVDLSFQPTEEVDGEALVSLAAVVAASGISESPNLYTYDFEGSDGFRPVVDRGEEALDYETLSSGWIHPASGDLSWDASLDLAGAWTVGDCAAVHLLEVEQPAASVEVVYGEESVVVNLGDVAAETVEGEELVPLDAIVAAADLSSDAKLLGFDFEGSDGFRPTVDREAEPLDFTSLGAGWMHPVSRNLSWDESLGLSGWWSVSDVARIHVLDP